MSISMSMSSIRIPRGALLVVAGTAGLLSTLSTAPASSQTTTTRPQTAAGLVTVPTKVRVVLNDPTKQIALTAAAPKGWERTVSERFNSFRLTSSRSPVSPFLEVTVNCDGECTDAVIDKTIARLIPAVIESAKRPNLNTGDPTLDAVRAPVKVLSQGKLKPAGQWIAYDVGTPNPNEPYFDGFRAVCLLHRTKEDFYVETNIGLSRQDKALFPALLEACKATR